VSEMHADSRTAPQVPEDKGASLKQGIEDHRYKNSKSLGAATQMNENHGDTPGRGSHVYNDQSAQGKSLQINGNCDATNFKALLDSRKKEPGLYQRKSD